METNIILIGFMGTGKSTVSKMLCKMTGWREVDVDAHIVEQQGMEISAIFERDGEEGFRDIETAALDTVLQGKGQIISCGGGAVLREKNVELMKTQGKVVLLTATPETIYDRVKNNTTRPILNGNMNVAYISELMKKRENAYLAAADITISTDNQEVLDICKKILEKMGIVL